MRNRMKRLEIPLRIVENRRRMRRGVTLIELVVVITMLGTILSLAGMTFHLILRTEKVVSQAFVIERTISRLAAQFRDDVHWSESGSLIDATDERPAELELANPKGIQFRYQISKHGLARLIVEQGAIVGREDFRLPDCEVHFVAGSGADSLQRSVVIDRPSVGFTKTPHAPRVLRALEIHANLNRFEMGKNEVVPAAVDERPKVEPDARTNDSKIKNESQTKEEPQ